MKTTARPKTKKPIPLEFVVTDDDRWATEPVIEISYDALYVVNGKDLNRVLHTANYPSSSLAWRVVTAEKSIKKTFEFSSFDDQEAWTVVVTADVKKTKGAGYISDRPRGAIAMKWNGPDLDPI